jgi:ATP-dependent DNA helicase RecG
MQLGWVEELGSGVLNVNKYWQEYSNGGKPQFIEGASFKIVLPVSDKFFTGNQDGNQDSNYDVLADAVNSQIDDGVNDGVNGGVNDGVKEGVSERVRKEIIEIVAIIMINEGLKALDIREKRSKSIRTIERYLKLARQFNLIEFVGAPKTGGYYITKTLKDRIENKRLG